MSDQDTLGLTDRTPEPACSHGLRVVHLTRRPASQYGGVERVVRGVGAEMARREPGWRISLRSAFRANGGLEGVAGVSDVLAAVRLAWWLLRSDDDVAFVHCPECLWLLPPLRLAGRLARGRAGRRRIAVVAVWHGAGPRPALVLRPAGNRLARALASFRCLEERGGLWSDGHVAVHAMVEQDLRDNYGFTKEIVIIENPLDPSLLERHAGERVRRDKPGFTALWVGQTGHRKGLDVALAAVALARRRVPELRLLVAGVPAGDAVEGVKWLGVVPPNEVADVYEQADVLLFPTRYESFGLVVLEAMAAGMPVIVSDAVPPGVVTDGRNGVVVTGHEPADYAAALLRLHGDVARRAQIGQDNRQDVQRFDQAVAAGKYARVALKLVGGDTR